VIWQQRIDSEAAHSCERNGDTSDCSTEIEQLEMIERVGEREGKREGKRERES
jgi:hypothetical protein